MKICITMTFSLSVVNSSAPNCSRVLQQRLKVLSQQNASEKFFKCQTNSIGDSKTGTFLILLSEFFGAL